MTDISAVQAATAAALPSCTYNNGSSGVGATLTATSDGALTIDGYTVLLGDRVAVTQQSDATQNGIYSQTTLGDGSTQWVLTRTTDFDTPAAINAQLPFCVLNGKKNINSILCCSAMVTTIGTDSISFAQMIQGFARSGQGNEILYSADNVGIGSSIAEYALDVGNTAMFRNNVLVSNGLTVQKIYGANSTSGTQFVEPNGTTVILNIDPLHGLVGVNMAAPPNNLSVSPVQYSTGTASQSGTTVTGVGTSWTSDMVGSLFAFARGDNDVVSGTITAVSSATSLTLDVSQGPVSSQNYTINYPGLQVNSTGQVGIGTASPAVSLDLSQNTDALALPVGTTGQRPTGANGEIRYNSSNSAIEGYIGGAWASLSTGGGGGGGLSWQSVQTSAFTAVAGNGYPVNTTSAAITVTLPASPTLGQQVGIVDYAGTFGTNNLTINPNGSKINSGSGNQFVLTPRASLVLTYIDSTQGWLITSQVSTAILGYTASYLVVAGGGAPCMGGGGAGGFRTGSFILASGVNYPVVIGAGGASNTGSGVAWPGGNSSVNGIVSLGGGGGTTQNGGSGGSGAGGGGYGGGLASGGAGTAGQGNAGGSNGSFTSIPYPAGGGGGASAAGANAPNSTTGGNGGAGTASSITGSSVTYAGGGGGAAYNGSPSYGTGGAGGGGNAGSTGSAGTANTGGGGGGSLWANTQPAGGSGVVILSVPTANYSGMTTGSPTVTTSGSNTIIKFTASGSYTA